jgi:hypothetical protein
MALDRMSVKFKGLCAGPVAGECALERLNAFGLEVIGVWFGVWLKGMYF